MKEVKLSDFKKCKNSNKFYTQIDDDSFDLIKNYRCFPSTRKHSTYVIIKINGVNNLLHRFLMNCTKGDGKIVDHIDGNGLNNQKSNLRICTQSENLKNMKGYGISKYKGVSPTANKKRFRARIKHNNKQIFLGVFDTEIEAAMCYNKNAKDMFGNFANLNNL